jgi:hypothetical protein
LQVANLVGSLILCAAVEYGCKNGHPHNRSEQPPTLSERLATL